jgi:hypothetical protein
MNKYELTRGGMRSLELLMTLMASYQEIKQKNSERTAETHTKILVVAASAIVVGISGRTVSIRIPMLRILLFLAVSKVNRPLRHAWIQQDVSALVCALHSL